MWRGVPKRFSAVNWLGASNCDSCGSKEYVAFFPIRERGTVRRVVWLCERCLRIGLEALEDYKESNRGNASFI